MGNALSKPLKLACGQTLPNRLAKSALTEGLADSKNRATQRHLNLYKQWAQGGTGLVITGNVQVDRRYLERPGNVALDNNGGQALLKKWAQAGLEGENHLWMQIGHAGRQTPRTVCQEPVAPSAVALEGRMAGLFSPPRALESSEIEDVIQRFAKAAAQAQDAGFTGAQIHSAHGYLVSSFLSPRVNQRTDEWGGRLENRARLLIETIRAVRARVGPNFPVSIKLNSADFQEGGFSLEDCCQVVAWLNNESLDLLEISGGTYESAKMMEGIEESKESGPAKRESTIRREAFFLEYAQAIRKVAEMPMMITGGFRTRAAMMDALDHNLLDVIGLGRPLVLEPDLSKRLLDGSAERSRPFEEGQIYWFYKQLLQMGDGHPPDLNLDIPSAIKDVVQNEIRVASELEPR